jgi:hypothetical protein
MQGKQAKIVSPTQERAMLGSLVTTRDPVAGSRHVSVVDEGRPARQRNSLIDVGHGHGCARAGGGGAARV